jgi:hypothetical protein
LLPAGWWMKKMVEEDVFPLQPASQPAVKWMGENTKRERDSVTVMTTTWGEEGGTEGNAAASQQSFDVPSPARPPWTAARQMCQPVPPRQHHFLHVFSPVATSSCLFRSSQRAAVGTTSSSSLAASLALAFIHNMYIYMTGKNDEESMKPKGDFLYCAFVNGVL